MLKYFCYRFLLQIDLTNGNGSTTDVISGLLGEKMLSKTAAEVYEATLIKVCIKSIVIL